MLQNRRALLFAGDVIMLVISFWIMTLIRFDAVTQGEFIRAQANIFALLFIIWLLIFFIFDLYNLRRINPNPRNIGLIVFAMVTNVAISVLIFYIFTAKGITPKTNLAIIALLSFVLITAWRRIFYKIFTARLRRSIGLIGTSPLLSHLEQELKLNPHIGTVVAHWPSDEGIPESQSIDLLITESIKPETLLSLSRRFNTEILSLDNSYQILFGKIPVALMSDQRAVNIITQDKNHGLILLYRLVEIMIALIILIVTLPITLLTSFAIMLDSKGPILLRQARVGKNNMHFMLYKFRSMYALSPDGSAEQNGIVQWADKSDKRITRIGKIIRKLHIDEIPQMINILKGEISLVGPRPERPEIVATLEKEIPYYFLRHSIKPGFTGWAQIKFRYARSIKDSEEKLEYDLYYLENRNPLFGIGIFLKTLQIIFTH
jgi:lipopolysaccharide/colanic/teichoic acid biosynthesis glycosyltransferase